jgi:DNA helicase MCM9
MDERQEDLLQTFVKDLITICYAQFHATLLHDDQTAFHPIELSLIEYIQCDSLLSSRIVNEPLKFLPILNEAALIAQSKVLDQLAVSPHPVGRGQSRTNLPLSTKKLNVRITKPNDCKELKRTKVPQTSDISKLIFFKGTVIRAGMIKLVQVRKLYSCDKCGTRIECKYDKALVSSR